MSMKLITGETLGTCFKTTWWWTRRKGKKFHLNNWIYPYESVLLMSHFYVNLQMTPSIVIRIPWKKGDVRICVSICLYLPLHVSNDKKNMCKSRSVDFPFNFYPLHWLETNKCYSTCTNLMAPVKITVSLITRLFSIFFSLSISLSILISLVIFVGDYLP